MHFHRDGAPPHFTRGDTTPKQYFHWLMDQPQWSDYLAAKDSRPSDYSLLGWMKSQVYEREVNT
jgi:hypothetical protein